MQNMVMLCKVDSLVVNVIFHTSSKLYANVTSSKKMPSNKELTI